MADCFLLGAGFSRAIGGREMPLMSDLTDVIVPDFVQGLTGYDHHLVDGKLPIPDVEAWLSSLAEPQPYRDRADNLQAQALFFEIVRCLAFDLRLRTNNVLAVADSPPDWLAAFLRSWHERQVTVITFNYDTLIESTLPALEIPVEEAQGETMTCKRLAPGLVQFWAVMYDGLRLRPTKTFRLLKLHGSLNWYWDPDGNQVPIDVGVYERWGQDHLPDESELRYRAPGLEPFLVPPTTSKSIYLGQGILRETWRQAREALDQATNIYALGYSFPLADLALRAMLAGTLRKKTVVVVDRSGEAADSLRKLVPDVTVDASPCGGDNPIERFATTYASSAKRSQSSLSASGTARTSINCDGLENPHLAAYGLLDRQ